MAHQHLSIEEREEIQRGLWEKESVRSIAKRLGRSHSSVAREISRNLPPERRVYTPRLADARAQKKRKSRGRTDRLKNETIRAYVVEHLKLGWSPEQIAGRMKRDGIGSISHEAIYQFVYAQIHRGGNGWVKPGKEDLRPYLRRKQKRRHHHGSRKGQRIFKANGRSIDERPLIVDLRSRMGDWEGDTVEGKDHAPGVNTLLERKSGLFLVTKVKDKSSEATRAAVAVRLENLPAHTLTVDNGPENRQWQELEAATGLDVYFAHPYRSSERGANENANGLLREYFPKGTDFRDVPDEEIAKVEYALNTRPRKRHGFLSPLEIWSGAFGG
ncbi:MAG: IS30 family transposase [Patescibacteria group bacterium]|nr:IS30 family transposase [Patescibacteria group bacterium]